jgi:S1-C subfamily serine protease
MLVAPRPTPPGASPSPNLALRPAALRKARGDVREQYRRVAPATVIVRTSSGHGSGVVISRDGLILTNQHVAVHGARDGLRVKLEVEIGRLDADGVMARSGEPLSAHVLKWDRARDLALLRLDQPPADLRWIEVSGTAAVPGEPVVVLGHGGIGLLWAIRDCEVSGSGYLHDALARDVLSPERMARQAQAAKGSEKPAASARVLQTSCQIAPGDSGGPVVNRAGELVALNDFVLRDAEAPVTSNFHVDGREIRGFLADVPTTPPALLPDPWDAGEVGLLLDEDGDGAVDTFVLRGEDAAAAFLDLAQVSFPRGAKVPSPEEVLASRSFRAQAVFLRAADGVYGWYDTAGTGSYDLLLLADDDGTVRSGFRLGTAGAATSLDAAALPRRVVEPALVADESRRPRLARIAAAVLPDRWASGLQAAAAGIPSAFPREPAGAELVDLDRDGKPDGVIWVGATGGGAVLDLDQSLPAGLSPAAALEALRDRARFALVVRGGQSTWAFYDRTGSGGFDLALGSAGDAAGVVDQALALGAQPPSPLADQAGRLLLRPGLLPLSPAAAKRLAAFLGGRELQPFTARGERGLGSLPALYGGTWGAPEAVDVAGLAGSALGFERAGAMALVVDFAGRLRALPKEAVSKALASESLPASFALLRIGDREWAFYDRNGDGRLDLVLYAPQAASGRSAVAYVVGKDGKLAPAPDLADGPLFRTAVFRGAREKATAKKVFDTLGVRAAARDG